MIFTGIQGFYDWKERIYSTHPFAGILAVPLKPRAAWRSGSCVRGPWGKSSQ